MLLVDFHTSTILLINILIDFFTLEFFATHFVPYKHAKQYHLIRYTFILINSSLVFAPFSFDISYITIPMYFLIISSWNIKVSIITSITYYLIDFIIFISVSFICALINMNVNSHDTMYINYMTLLCNMTEYILFHLYVNYKQLKKLRIPLQNYLSFFASYFVSIAIMLYCCRLFTTSGNENLFYTYILLFICGVILFNLFNYHSIATLLVKQNEQNTLLQKYELEKDYVQNINDSLKLLSKIRHDFRNQLIIIDGYAQKNEINKLREYISTTNNEIGATKLYTTPSELISSLLNTKNAACQKEGISFLVSCQFQQICIDDFSIITILGNILDNAITAAAKTDLGTIKLSITQLDAMLEIHCENNHCETIMEKNGIFLTTKENEHGLHGIGLGNVKDCVDKLHGTMQIHHDTTHFHINLLIPNYK